MKARWRQVRSKLGLAVHDHLVHDILSPTMVSSDTELLVWGINDPIHTSSEKVDGEGDVFGSEQWRQSRYG